MSLQNLKSIFEDELKAKTEDYISNSVTNVANTKLNYNNNNLINQTHGFDVSMETRGGRNNPILDSLLRGRVYDPVRFSQNFTNENLFVKPESGEITDQLFKTQTFDPRAPFAKEGTLYFNTNKSFNNPTNPTDFSTAVGNNNLPYTPLTELGGQFKENLSWENLYNSNHSPKDNPNYKGKSPISYGPNVSRDNLNIRDKSTFRTSLISGVGKLISNLGLGGNVSQFLQDTGKEPYIVSKIPEKSGITGGRITNSNFLGRGIPIERGITDTLRLAKYLTSPAGLLFIGKQNILGLQTPNNSKLELNKAGYKDFGTNTIKLGVGPEISLSQAEKGLNQFYNPLSTLLNTFDRAGAGPRNLRSKANLPGLPSFDYTDYINTFKNVPGLKGSPLVSLLQGQNMFQSDLISSENSFDREILRTKTSVIPPTPNPKTNSDYADGNKTNSPYPIKYFNVDEGKFINNDGLKKLNNTFIGNGTEISQGKTYPKDSGDKHTLMQFGVGEEKDVNGRKQYKDGLSEAHPNSSKDGTIEASENGMPFYFKDMRDGAYVFFRAYLDGINESISPSWSNSEYMGRSESVYVYERAEREVNFTLKLYAQTKKELSAIYEKMNKLTSLCYPEYFIDNDGVNYGNRMKPPFTKLRIGEIFGNSKSELMGFLKSLSYEFPTEGAWETESGKRVPKYVTVAIGYQVIHSSVPNLQTQFYGYIGEGSMAGS